MADISKKEMIKRTALASGKILLSRQTLNLIRESKIEKGDPLKVAEIAAMNAVKHTYLLIPHCHQIPLDFIAVNFMTSEDSIEATCEVSATARTGVEMEAVIGVEMALATVWDMVKYLEKDAGGQYPTTRITDIRVIKKIKGEKVG